MMNNYTVMKTKMIHTYVMLVYITYFILLDQSILMLTTKQLL